jgi:hypothetical protein
MGVATMSVPAFRSEQTGNAQLDRIQNMVRTVLEYLRSLLWLTQRAYVALDADVTTASATYATLLSAAITTVAARSHLAIAFTTSGVHATNAATTFFKVVVDNADAKGCYATVAAGYAFSAAIVVRVPVVAGRHTVRVDWSSDNATAQIHAATVLTEHAAMSIHEEVAP